MQPKEKKGNRAKGVTQAETDPGVPWLWLCLRPACLLLLNGWWVAVGSEKDWVGVLD